MANTKINQTIPTKQRFVRGTFGYLSKKLVSIIVTIFIAVFITVLISNQPSQRGLGPPKSPFETSLESQIFLVVRSEINDGTIKLDENGFPIQSQVDAETERLRNQVGLNLPLFPRYLLWTYKALSFDWGKLGQRYTGSFFATTNKAISSASDLISQHLPVTLLLIGSSYLLVFMIGIPLSLFLSRNHGNWLDKFFTFLSPLSSIPSWVFGILLISIFAFQLRILPFGRIFDGNQPEEPFIAFIQLLKHMILPVTSIILSIFFQLVFMWRTYFVIYSEEDYVTLAQAKGLPYSKLERQYILRPVLPYILTSFITSLVSFWQLSMALEAVFNWPGLGWLYIKEALPNFWGETMEPGELIIGIGIVVIFSYLLGLSVFILDLAYLIIDPRIRFHTENAFIGKLSPGKINILRRRKNNFSLEFNQNRINNKFLNNPVPFSFSKFFKNLKNSANSVANSIRSFFREIRSYPSAIFGLIIIFILILGSIFAITMLPYDQFGKDYEEKRLEGRSYRPRTAVPQWTNIFSSPNKLSTKIINENSMYTFSVFRPLENGWIEKTTIFFFDFSYKEIPSEVFLYFDPYYINKPPFVSLEWKYPDGRIYKLKDTSIKTKSSYDFSTGININQLLNKNPAWNNWFVRPSQNMSPTPPFVLLFQEPGTKQSSLQRGIYQLKITSILFEEKSNLMTQLVLLGQVHGLAGTDYARRDLMVPLFWGMPFALLIGLFGTLITTAVAMILPAIGVWIGGWADNLIQRITEVNMVLPSLVIAVLVNVLLNLNIWIILGIVIVINALGSPIKILRSALLQAKESPYMESARSYGASNYRIITRYLIPRILPILIPQIISQIPSFIFWEATLGFFNIKSSYPSWGRIIYEGLTQGALYGSPYWVLEPILLLLLTSFSFAMLGSALERILNPRRSDPIFLSSFSR